MKLTEKQREFLENPFVGTITDLRPDGSPHTTVVWVEVDEAGVSFNTAYGRATRTISRAIHACRSRSSIRRTPTAGSPSAGTATLLDEGADEHIDRLAKKYLGKDSYPFRAPGERRVTVRISPTRIESRGLD